MGEVQHKQLSKTEKAAIIFLYMDDQLTSDVFSQMQDEEIKKVANAMLHLNKIPSEQVQGVLDEFLKGYDHKEVEAPVSTDIVAVDGSKIVETMLVKNLSRNRGQAIMSSLKNPDKSSVSSELAEADLKKLLQEQSGESLFELVQKEHPQFVAIVLANCKKSTAKEILEKFPEDSQPELLVRMASLTKVSGQMMNDLKKYLLKRINDSKKSVATEAPTAKKKNIDVEIEGMTDTVKLLKSLNKEKSMKIVEEIEKMDADIGLLISKLMFTMEDLERANDVGIRELLRAISNEDLKVALKTAPETVKQKFFTNMSQRASMILKEDIEVMASVKPEEIEVAQENVLKAAKNLMKEEKLLLSEAQGDD